ERKRRARINACLDELKDLMVYALQAEGESISKLEKADVLELTVTHLRKLKRQQMLAMNPGLDLDRFHAGYTACATEVSKCLASTGVDVKVGSNLMSHLGHKLNTIETSRVSPLQVRVPGSPSGSDCGYCLSRKSRRFIQTEFSRGFGFPTSPFFGQKKNCRYFFSDWIFIYFTV
ncbi:MAG: hypothetical protein GY786_22610, partial [Proteobacteria bacterium]|nr:hypothetical protein [Pseudomonadota bacterium]